MSFQRTLEILACCVWHRGKALKKFPGGPKRPEKAKNERTERAKNREGMLKSGARGKKPSAFGEVFFPPSGGLQQEGPLFFAKRREREELVHKHSKFWEFKISADFFLQNLNLLKSPFKKIDFFLNVKGVAS